MYEKYGNVFVAHETYQSVSEEKMRAWRPPTRISADAAILPVLSDLQHTSRDLIRNDSFASAAINAMVTGTVGSGLKPNSQPRYKILGITEKKAREFAEKAESLFQAWAEEKTCEIGCNLTFHQMEQLVFRSALEFGDVFVAKGQRKDFHFDLCLQLLEGARVRTPDDQDSKKVKGGIIQSKVGQSLAAFIAGIDKNGEEKFTKLRFLDPSTGQPILLHIANRKRLGQTRGIPYLANSTTLLRKMNQYTEGEISAAALSSFIAFVTKTPTATNPLPNHGIVDYKDRPVSYPQTIKPNTNIHLANGEEIDMLNPNRPNPNFSDFYEAMSKIVSSELEQPLQVILSHFEASYSASRAAIIKAYQVYKLKRKWFSDEFHKPVWRWFISECIEKGYLDAPGFFESDLNKQAYLACDWVGDAAIQLDPSKEAKGARELYDLGIISKKHLTQMLTGKSYEDVVDQLKKEKQMMPEEKESYD